MHAPTEPLSDVGIPACMEPMLAKLRTYIGSYKLLFKEGDDAMAAMLARDVSVAGACMLAMFTLGLSEFCAHIWLHRLLSGGRIRVYASWLGETIVCHACIVCQDSAMSTVCAVCILFLHGGPIRW